MSSGYALHPEAFADLDDIRAYIAQDNPDAADRVISEIFATIRGLVPFPNQGHKRPDPTGRPLRFTLVRDYLIAYAPDEKPLWVVAIDKPRKAEGRGEEPAIGARRRAKQETHRAVKSLWELCRTAVVVRRCGRRTNRGPINCRVMRVHFGGRMAEMHHEHSDTLAYMDAAAPALWPRSSDRE